MIETLSNWTRHRPRDPGWYWIRTDDTDVSVVRLQSSNRGLVANWPGRIYPEPIRAADYDRAEWCGPLSSPGR